MIINTLFVLCFFNETKLHKVSTITKNIYINFKLFSIMQLSQHRINDFALLKFINKQDTHTFLKAKNEIALQNTQYIQSSDSINSTVWDSGTYDNRLNKTYSNNTLFTPTTTEILNYCEVHFSIPQNFKFNENLFGFHVIIKNLKTGDVLISQIVNQTQFTISENKLLIDGVFWLEEYVFIIPYVTDACVAQITQITFDDIETTGNNVGYIYNYPYEFVTLIDEKPLPDYIRNKISLDDNHFLKIEISTTETKTIEQSILDYFELQVAEIKISHLITYGNQTNGYYSLRISNETNKYLPVNVGLNLLLFYDAQTQLQQLVDIIVETEISVDSKFIRRTEQIQTDLTAINPIINAQITHPTTNYDVTVDKITNVNQTVIESKTLTKILPIYQPIFVEFIEADFVYERKNIFFSKITQAAMMKILKTENTKEQSIISKITSDNKIYFDLSEIVPLSEKTTYELYDIHSSNKIGNGNITIKQV